jgi:FtsP/CotA-like multicopper oxidase with cupredoxin domain
MIPSNVDLVAAACAAIALSLMVPEATNGQESRGLVSELEGAAFEDYRVPVGRVTNGVLRITFDVRTAAWRPWGEAGPAVPATVFAADGAPPRVPGPLIRVTAGTPVHITLHNRLADSIVVRGLRDRSANPPPNQRLGAFLSEFVEVAPGEAAEVRFTPTVPGTYFYFGRVLRPQPDGRPQPVFSVTRGPFEGVLIVDPPDTPPPADERIFLIGHWADRDFVGSWQPGARFMINGRSWPHTERLVHAQNDTVRWRVINATGIAHPMHLHGVHFSVDARGNQWREEQYAIGERRLVVTETLNPSQTMRVSWIAKESGNWVFHCHLMRHMSWLQNAPLETEPDSHHGAGSGADLLGGLVLGITVRPDPDDAPVAEDSRRRVHLHIGMRPRVFGDAPAYGFVLQDGATPPAGDSVRFPGSPIVLTRDEPAEIIVHNHADVPLGVHWHGLELESRGDGVPGWSGSPGAVIPATAPRDSLVVRMTPPRAGTFMYHVHSEPGHQLAQGLYGAFLVMEPGQSWDPEVDRVFLLGSLGAELDAPPAMNGEVRARTVELSAGTTYRLRFMHISPDDMKQVQLLSGEGPVTWQSVAKDAADLPPSHVRSLPADFQIDVGETYDFAWTPERAGDFLLRIVTTFQTGPPGFTRPAPPPHTMDVPVRVR